MKKIVIILNIIEASIESERSEVLPLNNFPFSIRHCSYPFHFVVLTSSAYSQQASRLFIFHLITLKHTPHSAGLLWTRDRPVPETSTWQNTNTHKRQTSMPTVGFEPTIPASARPQTYALESAATGVGTIVINHLIILFFCQLVSRLVG
jgi:hypothetical protein